MTDLKVEIDPAEVGFDSQRLARIDRHFAPYVDDGRLPGWLVLVARRGQIAHVSTYGQRDRERSLPVESDTVWRLASMTKPVTSVAAMMLYEEGAFELKDPVSKYIPAFADMSVFCSGSALDPLLRPATEPVRIWHLMTHTAGLTYGFHYAHPVDTIYRNAGFELIAPPDLDLAAACDAWASFPLLFEPGTRFNYSVATDVLGRVVEVISGQTLDEFFRTRIFEPLGMVDTSFWARPGSQQDRLAAPYAVNPGGPRLPAVPMNPWTVLEPPTLLLGGGGLVGTAGDYLRFAEMLRRGGTGEGARLLSPRTVAYMTTNQLPGGVDLEEIGTHTFAETTYDGVGFGLGFSVVLDPPAGKVLTSPGAFGWGGAFSTVFWVAPAEDLTVLFFTQLLPSKTHPIRSQLAQLVYQSLVD